MSNATIDRNVYGTRETNGLVDGQAYHAARKDAPAGKVSWTTPGLRITRLRLLSDPGFPAWDVSYCHGKLDGKDVDVELPFSQLRKHGKSISSQIVGYAIRDGINAKRIGALGAISKLN